MNDLLDKIDDELFLDNCKTEIIEKEYVGDLIEWKDSYDTENHVDEMYIDAHGDLMAWWQFNDSGKDLVRIKRGELILNWRPPINSMGTSMGCIFLKFWNDMLILAFSDKHCDRLYTIDTKALDIREIYFCNMIGVGLGGDYLFVKDPFKNEMFKLNLRVPLFGKLETSEEELKVRQVKLVNRDTVLMKNN